MSLEVIYLTRHGFRSNWAVDAKTGEYTTSIPSPTGIASDPALAGHGVEQSHQLAAHLRNLDPPIQRFYSSPFYRCIQTILPTVEAVSATSSDPETKKIRAENGLGEWYGLARFDHPSPAEPPLLKKLFPRFHEGYKPFIRPSINGERIEDLHNRVAYALHRIVEQCDREGVKAIAICTHGATLIAIGRALVGRMPEDISEQDFNPFTCGLTTFVRKSKENIDMDVMEWEGPETEIPVVKWRGGRGVGGGWMVTVDGDCSFLADGEERGWRFSGDESFIAAKEQDAGELGVVVERKKDTGSWPTSRPPSPLQPVAAGIPSSSTSEKKPSLNSLNPSKL